MVRGIRMKYGKTERVSGICRLGYGNFDTDTITVAEVSFETGTGDVEE